ncbi:MAG: undecaprenyl-phosphate glucose phosphotransferase [Lachnospiraceae bacterium]|nr:undecaprenyl-phosphate glucose phosphotransferase [Candidatus Equihabitans merdae]
MVEKSQKFYNRFLLVMDAVVMILAYVLAWSLRFRSGLMGSSVEVIPMIYYMAALILLVPGTLILNAAFGLYTGSRVKGRRNEIAGILGANISSMLILLMVLYLVHQDNWSRSMIFVFYMMNIVVISFLRLLVNHLVKKTLKSGKFQRNILLIGYSRAAEEFIDRVIDNPEWGFNIRGILDDKVQAGTLYKNIKVLGRIDNLMIILPENHLDEIVITLGLSEYYRLEQIVTLCEKSGVHTKFVPDYNKIIPTRPYTEDLKGLPVVNIRYVPLTNPFWSAVKRLMDIVLGSIGLIVASPVMLVCAILIKATDKGPLVFEQERVGLHNKTFKMYKFRSMVVQDESKEKKAWTVKDDPRVTKIGKFMRKTSVDELPQLINIIKGDMSLVGPRPERPFFVEKFQEEIPRYMVKHQVRPGLTGWAQVNGYRGNTSIARRIECDLYHIENWTIGLDIKIMFLTVFKGFINKNAY